MHQTDGDLGLGPCTLMDCQRFPCRNWGMQIPNDTRSDHEYAADRIYTLES